MLIVCYHSTRTIAPTSTPRGYGVWQWPYNARRVASITTIMHASIQYKSIQSKLEHWQCVRIYQCKKRVILLSNWISWKCYTITIPCLSRLLLTTLPVVVKYTDVDYKVFSDAARHVHEEESPFLRTTYRYTPLLAFVMLPSITIHPAFGKLVFVVCDLLVGMLVWCWWCWLGVGIVIDGWRYCAGFVAWFMFWCWCCWC